MWAPPWPLPNVWVGTSIESDEYCWRADVLREIPAAVRFLSCEPLLGPLPSLDLTGIDWMIVGGESGPNCRSLNMNWVRDLRDRRGDTALFFKQVGGVRPKAGVDSFDGRTWTNIHALLPKLAMGSTICVSAWRRNAQIERPGGRGECALSLISLGAQERQGQLQSLDFAAPALADGALVAGEQVFFQFVQAGSILGLTDSIWQRRQACSCWQAVP